jgi:hypothetical protein
VWIVAFEGVPRIFRVEGFEAAVHGQDHACQP